jgi:thiol-disulfide isomerase/thioredoxin
MVIDFTAKWCGPCKVMDPVLKDFAAKYTDVEFIKLDVDELLVCYKLSFTLTSLLFNFFFERTSLLFKV